jgi:hypothetical protein
VCVSSQAVAAFKADAANDALVVNKWFSAQVRHYRGGRALSL